MLCILTANTTGTQIEKLFIVDTTDSRTVAAFHIVGINLQLRFSIDLSMLAQQQVVVGHLAVGFQCVLRHFDHAVEDGFRAIVDDHFVQLVAVAITFIVFQIRTGISNLSINRQNQAVHVEIGVLAVKLRTGVITGQTRAQQETVAGDTCITTNNQIIMREVEARLAFKCQLVMREISIVAHVYRHTRTGKVAVIVKTQVMLNHFSVSAAFDRHMIAMMDGIHFT